MKSRGADLRLLLIAEILPHNPCDPKGSAAPVPRRVALGFLPQSPDLGDVLDAPHGLSMAMLYKVRRQLVHKGIAQSARQPQQTVGGPGTFDQVRVQDSPAEPEFTVRDPVCRLRHPRGWLIECGMWPEPSRPRQLMGERP